MSSEAPEQDLSPFLDILFQKGKQGPPLPPPLPDLVSSEETRLDEQFQEWKAHSRQERRLRAQYSERLYRLVCWWLVSILFIVMLQGMTEGRFELPTWTMNILIGSTTISIVSLVAIVATYLFPKTGSNLFSPRQGRSSDRNWRR